MTATNGPFARRDCAVDRARDQLLAGAGLAAEQHGRVARADARRRSRRTRCAAAERPTSSPSAGPRAAPRAHRRGATADRARRRRPTPRRRGARGSWRRAYRSASHARALAIDPQDADDVVAAAVDRRGDQRAAAGLGGHDLLARTHLVDEILRAPGAASTRSAPTAAATGATRRVPADSTNARCAPSAVSAASHAARATASRPARGFAAQAIAELGERGEVAARAIVAPGEREQLAAADLHRHVARRAASPRRRRRAGTRACVAPITISSPASSRCARDSAAVDQRAPCRSRRPTTARRRAARSSRAGATPSDR